MLTCVLCDLLSAVYRSEVVLSAPMRLGQIEFEVLQELEPASQTWPRQEMGDGFRMSKA